MDKLTEGLDKLFWVLIVGIIGAFLNLSNKKFPNNKRKIIYIITGTISSMFICWITYTIALYFLKEEGISLALGGFFAWRGGEYANDLVDRFLNKELKDDDNANFKNK